MSPPRQYLSASSASRTDRSIAIQGYTTRHGYGYSSLRCEDAEESVDGNPSEFGMASSASTRSMKLPSVATVNASAKRFVGFAIISIGTTVLVVACLSFKSSRGLLWASVHDSTQLSLCPASCNRPSYYCMGDEYVYSERDCDGDGIPDPFCQGYGSVNGSNSCGCLQSTNHCFDNWPTVCPDFLWPRRNMLWGSANQLTAKAPAAGMLTFLNVEPGDAVSEGDVVAAIISAGKIQEVKSPGFGEVKRVLGIRAGDSIGAGETLVVLEKYLLAEPIKHSSPLKMQPNAMPIEGVISGPKFGSEVKREHSKDATAFRQKMNDSGLEILQVPFGVTFKGWEVDKYDKIVKGSAVAEIAGDHGKLAKIIWDGPEGMVMSRDKDLLPEDFLWPGEELIKVAQAIFIRHTVYVGQYVHKGDVVAIVWVGQEVKPIFASRDGTVVGNIRMDTQEVIGFDTNFEADPFSYLGDHLPELPSPVDRSKSQKGSNSNSKWLLFERYNVSQGDKVEKGDVIALARVVMPDGTKGLGVKFRADTSGYVTHLQKIYLGDLVGPGDDLFNVDEYAPVTSSSANVPVWIWLIVAFLLCPLTILILVFTRQQPVTVRKPVKSVPFPESPPPSPPPEKAARDIISFEDDEELPPMEDPDPLYIEDSTVVVQEAPVPEAEPEPAPIDAPPPPPGVPIYFDHQPYYMEYRPIGIKFHTSSPIQIEDFIFNSYGKTFGLRKRQRLTRIKDIDVEDDHSYDHVAEMLHDAIKDLPVWPLRIDFQTNSNPAETKSFLFTERPLGIVFAHQLPLIVEKFRPHSLAERSGVQLHWEIVKMADEETTPQAMKNRRIENSHAAFEYVDKNLLEGLQHLPYWPVRLEFKTPGGEMKTVDVSERPHGIQFSKRAVRVGALKPGCVAEELGIQIGWHLVRIMDNEITEEHDYKHASKLLEETMKHLPERRH